MAWTTSGRKVQILFGDQEGDTYLADWTVTYLHRLRWPIFTLARIVVTS